MMKIALNKEFGLYNNNDEPMCSSRQVAEVFEKRHDDVIKAIRNLECSEDFRDRNFAFVYKKAGDAVISGKTEEVLMTKDGFTFLAMGFTGKKAAMFKENYINKFNQMSDYIQSLRTARLEYPEMTAAIQAAHEDPKSYHFSNEANMINKIVLGKTAKQIREEFGLKPGESIRPCLSADQIRWVEKLQKRNTVYLEDGIDYEERKAKLIVYYRKQNTLALETSHDNAIC